MRSLKYATTRQKDKYYMINAFKLGMQAIRLREYFDDPCRIEVFVHEQKFPLEVEVDR